MDRGQSGDFHRISNVGEVARAFVPHALPPSPQIDLSGERQRLLEKALLACGQLDGLSALLPDRDLFIYSYVRREAVLSSQIEGTQSSLSDLLLFELDDLPGVPIDDVTEVSNYVAALAHGLRRLEDGLPISGRLLREIHAALLQRGRGAQKEPGEFRRSQNWIGGTRPGNANFVPPPPERIADCIGELEQFINDDDPTVPALARAAMAHVQFETIHPFLDGNGRVGRLLIVLMLRDAEILDQPLLYLSLYFKQNRDDYYRLLDEVRYRGDWEAWLEFFLEGVYRTANAAVDTANRLIAVFGEDQRQVEKLGRRTPTALRVFEAFRARPVAMIGDVAERSGVSYPTAAKRIDELSELGIVRELTGRHRNRVFTYDRYLQILSEGTEPL